MLMLIGALLLGVLAHRSEATEFQIVWVTIGDAETSKGEGPPRAGRHLFMAADLTEMALKQIAVAKVEVTPEINSVAVGEKFCLTSLKMVATQPNRSPVKLAPLSVSVRQDHRDALGLERTADDICIHPSAAGEYPIRFTSVLPAADGTIRGAQIFIRVTEPTALNP
ncbi:MAG TPA: hypothetical protein VKB34_15175 [Povalibacter sp.]|nr:hypothetical protein [Povalibacter sp.]